MWEQEEYERLIGDTIRSIKGITRAKGLDQTHTTEQRARTFHQKMMEGNIRGSI